VEPPK
jgi:hypothetical protein